MTTFVVLATLLVALALAILLTPFLRAPRESAQVSRRGTNLSVLRDQLRELERDRATGVLDAVQFEEARADVERMAAEEILAGRRDAAPAATSGMRAALLLAIALPAFALAWYGAARGWRAPGPAFASAGGESAASPPHEDLATMTAKLEARLRDDPGSAEGWYLLARTHHAAQRYDDAVAAYERARKLLPADPDILSDYADTLAMAQGRTLAGKPVDLINAALAAKPDHPKALLLAGSAAFAAGDFRAAAGFWERATQVTQPGTDFGDTARGALADARARLGETTPATGALRMPTPAATAAPPGATVSPAAPAAAPAAASTVEGMVTLAPALAGKAGPDDTVFVLARAVKGPPMPLAVKRFKVRDLPVRFSVSDADAMMPELTISKIADIVMVARVSRSGEPRAASGDLEGMSAPLRAPQRDLALEINRVLP